MRRKGKWGEFSKERLKVSKDVSIKWSYLLLAREGGEASPSTKLSSCAFNSGQSGQEASQRETWERRIEDRNYFRFIDEPIILHLWRSCLKFYFEFVCSQFSSFHPSPIVFRGFFRKRFVLVSSRCIPWRIFLDNIFLHFSLLKDDNILSILVTKSAIHFG